jgi:hypothetical protein
MDPYKVEIIKDWPSPKNIFEVRSFHGLSSLYHKYIRNFSGINATMMDTVKKRHKYFHWTEEAKKSFNLLKRKMHGTTSFGVAGFPEDISSEMRCKWICNRGSLESRRQADSIFQREAK